MVRVMKSPNMISTTGRMPVMAAPTAIPVKPASEIGVSITRRTPNSCTRPEKTLNGVPASATSSPMIKTLGSRRISSARASRIASAKVISRLFIADVDMLINLGGGRKGSVDGELYAQVNLRLHLAPHLVQVSLNGDSLGQEPIGHDLKRITPRLPFFFFLL